VAITWITAAELPSSGSPYAEEAAQYASWILYKLTGEKYPGIRTATEWLGVRGVEPTSCYTFTNYGDYTWVSRVNGSTYKHIRLRGQPVVSITSVEDRNGVVDPSAYRLVNHSTLMSGDSPGWDVYNGITVTYMRGTKPPAAGRTAAITLAEQLILAIDDDSSCRLPTNVQSISRQGLDIQLIDPMQFLEHGRVGLYEVDLFIAAANPNKARKRARVYSAQIPRGERYS
jgi:hypothetical protein